MLERKWACPATDVADASGHSPGHTAPSEPLPGVSVQRIRWPISGFGRTSRNSSHYGKNFDLHWPPLHTSAARPGLFGKLDKAADRPPGEAVRGLALDGLDLALGVEEDVYLPKLIDPTQQRAPSAG